MQFVRGGGRIIWEGGETGGRFLRRDVMVHPLAVKYSTGPASTLLLLAVNTQVGWWVS